MLFFLVLTHPQLELIFTLKVYIQKWLVIDGSDKASGSWYHRRPPCKLDDLVFLLHETGNPSPFGITPNRSNPTLFLCRGAFLSSQDKVSSCLIRADEFVTYLSQIIFSFEHGTVSKPRGYLSSSQVRFNGFLIFLKVSAVADGSVWIIYNGAQVNGVNSFQKQDRYPTYSWHQWCYEEISHCWCCLDMKQLVRSFRLSTENVYFLNIDSSKLIWKNMNMKYVI